MNRTMLAFLLSTAFALAACGSHNADNNMVGADDLNATVSNDMNSAADMNTAAAGTVDSAFLTDAMKGDNSEVAIGQLAQKNGASQGVKDFGKMLETDHGAHKQKVAALAQQAGIAVPDGPSDEGQANIDKLKGLTGAAFDKAFADAMVEDHQKDIAKYEAQAKSDDATTAQLAKDTLLALRKHLETAQKLQK